MKYGYKGIDTIITKDSEIIKCDSTKLYRLKPKFKLNYLLSKI